MDKSAPTIGAGLVVYDPTQVLPLRRRVAKLQAAMKQEFDCALMLSASGSLSATDVRTQFEAAGLRVIECRVVEDRYFDFSGYQEAARLFAQRGTQGVVFINDTLASKHDSAYLLRTMAHWVAHSQASEVAFPLLVGPYRHSEFSAGDGAMDEFVATFMFYLNGAGVRLFVDLLQALPSVHAALQAAHRPTPGLQEPLLRICRLHAAQLRRRYANNDPADEKMARKLSTVYMERELTLRVRAEGVVWYAAGGMFGRLAVPMQIGLNRLGHRLFALRPSW